MFEREQVAKVQGYKGTNWIFILGVLARNKPNALYLCCYQYNRRRRQGKPSQPLHLLSSSVPLLNSHSVENNFRLSSSLLLN